jgi:hypothetical protein
LAKFLYFFGIFLAFFFLACIVFLAFIVKREFYLCRSSLIITNLIILLSQKRINQIKTINLKQSIKGILFCNCYKFDYPEIIRTLHERKFKFILLERNIFDRALSHNIVAITHFAHRWKGVEGSPDSLEPITIDAGKWLESLFAAYQATEYRHKLFANYEFITVNYENLIEDCQRKGIPIQLKSNDILKTWNLDYKDIVTNIDELQIIYDSFIKMIPMYSGFLLKNDK